jgi:predicted DNA-binding transcriptional regulator YafY
MNIIRIEMDLPLIRRNGYRFEAQSSEAAVSLELAEAQLLLLLLRRAEAEKGMPAEQVRRLMNKLPTFLPTHLRPLLHKMVESGPGHTRQRQHLEKLTSAILNGKSIKLHYPRSAGAPLLEPVVKPSMLLPYLDSWYVIGMCKQRKRLMMFELDTATSVKDG